MEHPRGGDIYCRHADFVFRRIVDECILVPVRQSVARLETIYTLNEVGAHVWERLDGQTTVDHVLAGVVAAFEVQPAQARKDLLRFLRALEHAGAVERVADAGP
ncbi:MAG: PqqD family protein [Chloroflexi bacterium]|nr:PqqD family protein [Chloroflexota bacterium]